MKKTLFLFTEKTKQEFDKIEISEFVKSDNTCIIADEEERKILLSEMGKDTEVVRKGNFQIYSGSPFSWVEKNFYDLKEKFQYIMVFDYSDKTKEYNFYIANFKFFYDRIEEYRNNKDLILS